MGSTQYCSLIENHLFIWKIDAPEKVSTFILALSKYLIRDYDFSLSRKSILTSLNSHRYIGIVMQFSCIFFWLSIAFIVLKQKHVAHILCLQEHSKYCVTWWSKCKNRFDYNNDFNGYFKDVKLLKMQIKWYKSLRNTSRYIEYILNIQKNPKVFDYNAV